MEVKSKKVNMWFIQNNELKNANKMINVINYKGIDILTTKDEMELLFVDKNNVYWDLSIAPIDIERIRGYFILPNSNECEKYCDELIKLYDGEQLPMFFRNKIACRKYFNKCELKYLELNIPELYEKAKESRETFVNARNARIEREKQEEKERIQGIVNNTNELFENKLTALKQSIIDDKQVEIENLEFYKDNDYYKGKTTQNCILYLAKEYGITIPLATQGFINNRLVNYDFGNGNFAFRVTDKNKKASVVMHKYMREISKCVKEENKENVKELKNKLKEMKEGIK